MIGTALFATIWNLISAPALFFVPSELADGNRWAWVALLFPAVGLVLAGWAVLAFLRWRKFGDATFELSTNPGVLGGYLEGRIDTSLRHALQEGVDLTLSCVRTVTSGSGDNPQHAARSCLARHRNGARRCNRHGPSRRCRSGALRDSLRRRTG